MATKIRLMRMGKKKAPFYRVVVADSRSPRDGKFIEIIGTYNPLKNPVELKLDEEKVSKWLGVGAIPTDTVRSLFKKAGLKNEPKLKKAKKTKSTKVVKTEEKTEVKKTPVKKTTTTKKTATKKEA